MRAASGRATTPRQFLDAGAAHLGHAAELAQKLLRGARADAGDFVEFAGRVRLARAAGGER